MKTSYFSESELEQIGFKKLGQDVKISSKTSIYSPETIEIGNHVRIDDFVILSGSLKIGHYVHIGAYSGLFGGFGITLGDFSGLSSRVSIYTVSEDYLGHGLTNPTVPDQYRNPQTGPVVLSAHVIVGAGSVILPCVTIGEGAAVGALSLVQGSLKEWIIAKGNPAKPIGNRKKDLIKRYEIEITRKKEEQLAAEQ
jgi:galactoside O-acetyltransferase